MRWKLLSKKLFALFALNINIAIATVLTVSVAYSHNISECKSLSNEGSATSMIMAPE
jgi:hypothetical protein